MAKHGRHWGAGTSAIVRALIAADGPVTQVHLAELVRVSQPRVSQVVAQLSAVSAVTAQPGGYVGDRSHLIRLYVERHKPVLSRAEAPWYGLQSMSEQVEQVCSTASARRVPLSVSADLAPDLIAPWRHPTITVVYSAAALDLSSAGFVPAESRVDATVIVRPTNDASLLSAFEPWPRAVGKVPLADPVQQIWDLHDLGGADRVEAAARLADVVIDRTIGASR